MYIRINDLTAKCPACGHPDFRPLPGKLTSEDRLTCGQCGVQTRYGELLDHMGEEAIRRAHDALEELKRTVRKRT
jgi:ribosomal protein S27AE